MLRVRADYGMMATFPKTFEEVTMSVKRWQKVGTALWLSGAVLYAPSALAQTAPGAHAPATATAPAAPEDAKASEARSRYKAGLVLYEDGAYDAARVQFERAYELAPSYRILYNVGLVQKQLNDFVGALRAFERYLAEGAQEIPAERRTEVQKLIETLQGITASVRVQINVPDAEISVDDAVVGKSPMAAPVVVNPGRRKFSAKRAGKLPDAKVITVASGDRATVDLSLGEAVVINQGTDVKPIIAWIATGGFAIGAGTLGYLANVASSDRKDAINRRDAQSSDIQSAADKQKTLALVSDVLTVGAILSAGVAVYFTWFNSPKEKKTGSPTARRITPGVGNVLLQF
jgi:hypothetical protein